MKRSSRKKTSIKSHLVNLKDYQIIKEINRGGFGAVYLIEDNRTGRRLAAKVNLRPDKSPLVESKLLSREIAILMRVEGTTIIRFCGFSLKDFQGHTNVTILMKYYQNGSLSQLIEQEQKGQSPHEYDNTAKQIILCGIAHGMMTLHSRRVLHRDLKPDNVLLDHHYRPYISDFGLSKFLDPTNSKSQSMSGCGTAPYMSPEVIDDTHYSTKSDVYSFGILMFEVLTGEFAFSELYKKKNFNPFQITSRAAKGDRPKFNVPIKPSFKKLIEQCWSQDPKERPTFRELFHKLSLSLEDDDDTIESSLQDLICSDNETEEFEYLLDDVDTDQLFDYVYDITSERTKKEEELERLVKEQTKHFNSIIQQQQQEIDQLKADNQQQIDQLQSDNQQQQQEIDQLKTENSRNLQEIELLKSKLNEFIEQSFKPVPANQSDASNSNVKAASTHPENTETVNPLEGLTIAQIIGKIKKEKLTQITIPSSVTSIGDYAFSKCNSLTQITIPSSVTSIGDSAFFCCSSLTQITIPSSVTSIGEGAFCHCSSLTQITIPSSVTSIGKSAFYGCSSLTQITIPSSVTSIDGNPFFGCSNLENIYADPNNSEYASLDGILFTKKIKTLICYACKHPQTSYTIPSSVTSIGQYAFCHCSSLTQITIPSSVTSIGEYAFSDCSSLTQITIPSSVTSIGDGAFYNCNLDSSIVNTLKNLFGQDIFEEIYY